MVSSDRARPCGRLLQHGRLARLDARRPARRVGDSGLQLAVRFRADRRHRSGVGRTLARVLPVARDAQGAVGA
jgi:hypothetical protein